MTFVKCILWILFSKLIATSLAYQRTVNSSVGIIVGDVQSIAVGPTSEAITTFLGIPYAEPPTGNRRFRKPVKKEKFNNTFSALTFGASCPQYSSYYTPDKMDEDCLFLNIYSPDTTGSAAKVPVMVWIHGGGFRIGDGKAYGGEKLAAYGQVVVVTLNYRLGPLGFLNVFEDVVDANNGLWDQRMAMVWVKDNILSFGGDPNSITLFGQSSGAAAVMYQATYPGNEGIIHRAIAESGSCNADWALITKPVDKAKEYARKFNCPVTTNIAMVQCLRNLDNLTLIAKWSDLSSSIGEQDWGPSLDGDMVDFKKLIVLTDPTSKTKLSEFNNLDLLMGSNGYDGQSFLTPPLFALKYAILTNSTTSINEIKRVNRYIISTVLIKRYGYSVANKILDAVMFEYTNFEEPANKDLHIKQSTDFMTAINFLYPTILALDNHAHENTRAKTYQYQFDELFPFQYRDSWIKGAVHSDETLYVFGFPESIETFYNYTQSGSVSQWNLVAKVMDYWTNFAKSGDPNVPRSPTVKWNEYTSIKREYLYIASQRTAMKHNLDAKHVHFWINYLPGYIKRVTETAVKDENCTSSSCRISIGRWNIVIPFVLILFVFLSHI
ncbi:hypothetical protein SNE40_008105 [Patella caerulea]|uniref:Carboxylic ester hydrolase n=1 Tax=Patella caerulea TaxID=87958 RepID=A0AAN8PW38_PATCE